MSFVRPKSSTTNDNKHQKQVMNKPFTLADLTPYVNDQVETFIVEEYDALSEETKRSINLREYWLLGTETRRLVRENAVRLGSSELKALLDSFIATRRIDLKLLAKSNFDKLLFSNNCDNHRLIDLCAGEDWEERKNPDGNIEDPWYYLRNPDVSHTVYDESFYSKSAVPGVLLASRNVHFDMFRDYFDCLRIKFPAPQGQEHRNRVSSEFLEMLGFEEADIGIFRELLQRHAIRWAKAQVVLYDQIGATKTKNEPLTQHLLEILLSDLLIDLQTHWNYRPLGVFDVTGMDPISVPVTVCANYMTKQIGAPTDAKVCKLIARCDLSIHPETHSQPLDSIFLQALVNIEVKSALTMLRGVGGKEKTQTLVESLARQLKLETMSARQYLFSILCDGGCLNVLVHDINGKRCYLSHREISPGRIVAIIAWVLRKSAQSTGIGDGSAFNTQLLSLVAKQDSGGDVEYADDSSYPDHDLDTREDDEGQNVVPHSDSGYAKHLSDELTALDSESEDEFDAHQREIRATSMAFHKNKTFGKELPLIAGVLKEFQKQG